LIVTALALIGKLENTASFVPNCSMPRRAFQNGSVKQTRIFIISNRSGRVTTRGPPQKWIDERIRQKKLRYNDGTGDVPNRFWRSSIALRSRNDRPSREEHGEGQGI